ncbi:MAG TPA: hypothetical protein VNL77_08560 [Roseiflexaceae bacterium]|nr:hypothetical protein [Roseiflexaceae bacterium]
MDHHPRNVAARRWWLAAVLLVLLALLAPPAAQAHERWFVEEEAAYPVDYGRLLSLPVLVGALASAALVGALALLRRLAGGDNLFPRLWFLSRFDPSAPVVIAIHTAIAVVYTAVHLRLLAVNLELPPGPAGYLLAGAQLAAAFFLVSGLWARAGAALLVALVLLTGALFGPLAMLEQSIFAGIGLYIALMGRGMVDLDNLMPPPHPLDRYRPLAPVLLRIFAGLSVAALALSEKLLNPALGVAFLHDYPHFNVARALGLSWFSDERFILAAGVVELAIGAALIAGILPRLVIFAMFVPFNLTIPFLPATELIGHLPIFAVMYVLVFHNPLLRVDAPEGPSVAETVGAEGAASPAPQGEATAARGR